MSRLKIDVVMSTMNQKNMDIIKTSNIKNGVIVNQIGFSEKQYFKDEKKSVTWINSDTKGLSVSRNLAIQTSKADFCVISDDDLIYDDDYEYKIQKSISNHENVDVFVFQIEGINDVFKKYPKREKNIGYLRSMKVASVEIVINRQSIIDNDIKFKEEFGSGAKYRMGEENIFLFDCLRKGLRIKYIPIRIGRVYLGESSWFDGYNERYFRDLGAVYWTMSSTFFIILTLQFLVRKYHLYNSEITFMKAFKSMLIGRKSVKEKGCEFYEY